MIKNLYSRVKGPHFFLTLVFLGLGLIILTLSVKGYKEHSQKEIDVVVTSGSDPEVSVQEMEDLFSSNSFSMSDAQVIVDRNLFSPVREAWEPPPPSEEAPTQRSRVNQRDFMLYGITQFQGAKTALVYYQRLPEKYRHRLVNEGEVIYDDQRGNELYRVSEIKGESVVLEAGGDTFEVGLFTHDRQKVEPGKTEQIAVVIGGSDLDGASLDANVTQPEPVAEPKPSVPSDGQEVTRPAQGSGDAGLDEADSDASEEPERLSSAERIRKMAEEAGSSSRGRGRSIEDLERQVQEGTMRKVETELGTFYRRVVD